MSVSSAQPPADHHGEMSNNRQAPDDHGEGSKNILSMLEKLPDSIISDILQDLDLESLFSAACVSNTIRSPASSIIESQKSIDLSFFSPDAATVDHIHGQLGGFQSLTLDCLRLDNSAIKKLLGRNIQELNLLKCARLSDQIFFSIGRRCPDLRALVLELEGSSSFQYFGRNLAYMVQKFSCLESLCINMGTEVDACELKFIKLSLPITLKVLKLKPIKTHELIMANLYAFTALTVLSLRVDCIADTLITFITKSLPHLVELDLEDRPKLQDLPCRNRDLTNLGLECLGTCQNLSTLSLVRSRKYLPLSFNKVNDMGMFLLSGRGKGLRSIKLGGFTEVTDAGFSSIFHSCLDLEKIEVLNAPLLSDLAFQNVGSSISGSLVALKLWLCDLVTSDTLKELSSCFKLEVLNFSGCKSIVDGGLESISSLCYLTTLNLEGADITDIGMSIIGAGSSPITNMCLRGCKRISDKGVYLLLCSGGIIGRTLTSLDLGFLSEISDEAVSIIADFGSSITELSIRNCLGITGTSLKDLGSEKRFEKGGKLIRRLDLYGCEGLTLESLELVKKPLFRGLRWLGLKFSKSHYEESDKLSRFLCEERPWLTVCLKGCEMGCNDGWEFHTSKDYNLYASSLSETFVLQAAEDYPLRTAV